VSPAPNLAPNARRVLEGFAWCLLGAVLGCAEISPPLPPPEPVLVIVDSSHAELRIIPVQAPAGAQVLSIPGGAATRVGLAARDSIVVLTVAATGEVLVINAAGPAVLRAVALPASDGVGGPTIVDDSLAYVGLPAINRLMRINYLTGDTASIAVGMTPVGVVATRSRVFSLNANLGPCAPPRAACPLGPSWLTVVLPQTNVLPSTGDSIDMPGPGNASSAVAAIDGLLYVMNAGDSVSGEGRLSLVDPVAGSERASFSGFGFSPGPLASSPQGRIFVASLTEGVMVFDGRSRVVLRGAGSGLPVTANTGVAADGRGYLYALQSAACGASPGTVRVFLPTLIETAGFGAGNCPAAAVITDLPGN
jgi:hypothetical protein